ncbi:nicotinamide-nucleotide amidohydrolase PncC [bacterium BMS3Bbin05]|nr:nicotinamide-nucleotide amidohydrolase PncC [bacterium BMS3Bbin05]HDL19735.1 CinA family protein [Nitrospirota bacterium]HDO23515.1 CinA family protein [Nitrospirota bacterium]HDZ87222.1 CinA family protein [Nitrospirota bacterium]
MQSADKNIVKQIHAFFRREHLTLSVAESCTGGMVANMITDLPGASGFFDTGIITYSNKSKTDMLSVKYTTIIKEGAVSEETARQMADGIRRIRNTDVSLSVTGNLGPSALEEKDIGLVYYAVSSKKGTFPGSMVFSGPRRQVKKQASIYGLGFLLQILAQ